MEMNYICYNTLNAIKTMNFSKQRYSNSYGVLVNFLHWPVINRLFKLIKLKKKSYLKKVFNAMLVYEPMLYFNLILIKCANKLSE